MDTVIELLRELLPFVKVILGMVAVILVAQVVATGWVLFKFFKND